MTLIGKKIINKRKPFLNYYIPDKENKIYSLIYHIVYHKGYIDKKYISLLKKIFKSETNFFMIKKKINQYLTKKIIELQDQMILQFLCHIN